MYITPLIISFLLIYKTNGAVSPGGLLFPRESETREVTSLNGLWNFLLSPTNDSLIGFRNHWYSGSLAKITGNGELQLMPVPSSYNDITQEAKYRDHVGLVWYDRSFFVPSKWNNFNTRVWLRFSSVSYAAKVWINGHTAMSHEIGHLPFQTEITSFPHFGASNRVTVACDNILLEDTVPQGSLSQAETDNGTKLVQTYTFDFFNYAGIQRPVTLYTTPRDYISDITVVTDIDGSTGIVHYNISFIASQEISCKARVLNKEDDLIVGENLNGQAIGNLSVPMARLWWPYLMDPKPGYLYNFQVELVDASGEILDVYRLPIGIRTITWTNTSLLINNRPIYLQGFGRHEDSDIRGKGLDLPLIVKDYNLIKWVGANAYRTSHYPCADEIMDLADQYGIMIIDECPSVNTDLFSSQLLNKHKGSLTEMIRRDKNRPSVIAWSLANEPRSHQVAADRYFEEVARHVKNIDTTRPITVAIAESVNDDKVAKHLDIISFNRYNAWYVNSGQLDMITKHVVTEATQWFKKYNKPILMLEYGADTYEGLHINPDYIWSEEFQTSLMSKHFQAFDQLRVKRFFIGEFIWNFADFKTAQTYTRVGGNKKGIFTRNRQPKAGAHHLRERYFRLAQQLYNVPLPDDLCKYVAPNKYEHNEL